MRADERGAAHIGDMLDAAKNLPGLFTGPRYQICSQNKKVQ